MEVTWLGGSCFRLRASSLQIVTDPFDLPPEAPRLRGAVVTLSRPVQADRLLVDSPYRVVDGPGEYEMRGVPITGIATRLRPDPDEPLGRRNIVYTATLDGVTVGHLGRLDQPPTATQLQEIGSPDVLIVPVGEGEGLPVAQAVRLASGLEARLLIPFPLGGAAGIAAAERFGRELGADPHNVSDVLSVTPSGLPAQARVVRLTPVLSTAAGGGPGA